MRTEIVAVVFGLTCGCANAADVYRWVDHNGVVNYSDQAPPGMSKGVVEKSLTSNVIDGQDSYELKTAAEKNPVVLYSTGCGSLCNDARNLLTQRGIPFSFKDPLVDKDAAKELGNPSGGFHLPMVKVGSHMLKGYESRQWNTALDAANYPKQPIPGGQRGKLQPGEVKPLADTAAEAAPAPDKGEYPQGDEISSSAVTH